jgi:hypothetical protein
MVLRYERGLNMSQGRKWPLEIVHETTQMAIRLLKKLLWRADNREKATAKRPNKLQNMTLSSDIKLQKTQIAHRRV